MSEQFSTEGVQPQDEGLTQSEVSETEVQPGLDGDEGSQQTAEEVFYDATKVPEHLQASFREMQAAWTKKNQELAPFRRFAEYGDPEQVAQFLDSMRTPEGIMDWWQSVAQRLGVTQEQLAALFEQEQQAGSPYEEDDLDQPMTRREWLEQQQEAQRAAQARSEDRQVASALQKFEVAEEDQPAVLALAYRQPRHLGYEERIRRGKEAFEGVVAKRAQSVAAVEEKNRARTPKSMGGATPAPGEKKPKSLDEARDRAQARLDRIQKADSL